jgi:hypothetical protein
MLFAILHQQKACGTKLPSHSTLYTAEQLQFTFLHITSCKVNIRHEHMDNFQYRKFRLISQFISHPACYIYLQYTLYLSPVAGVFLRVHEAETCNAQLSDNALCRQSYNVLFFLVKNTTVCLLQRRKGTSHFISHNTILNLCVL